MPVHVLGTNSHYRLHKQIWLLGINLYDDNKCKHTLMQGVKIRTRE